MRGRLSHGSWITPFDPASVQRPSNYVEGAMHGNGHGSYHKM